MNDPATLCNFLDSQAQCQSTARGRQVRNSYNFAVSPGASTSETDDNIINPAERNEVVGIKPTVALTSRNGVIPESEHEDTVGVFGNTVRDAVYALDVMYGSDPRDNYTAAQFGKTPLGGYAIFLANVTSLRAAVLGIP
ncbi:hypothetical protein LTR17_012116 [Elasticomyces elasticus]|nr:hypothetical protein LTR17_012116 [Elasticomyces elasticus]